MAEEYSIVHVAHIFFIHSSVDGHLVAFGILKTSPRCICSQVWEFHI